MANFICDFSKFFEIFSIFANIALNGLKIFLRAIWVLESSQKNFWTIWIPGTSPKFSDFWSKKASRTFFDQKSPFFRLFSIFLFFIFFQKITFFRKNIFFVHLDLQHFWKFSVFFEKKNFGDF